MKKFLVLFYLLVFLYSAHSQTIELLTDLNTNHTGEGEPSELTVFNGQLYFIREDPTNGSQIWRTDGTTTEKFTSILNGEVGNPYGLTVWNGMLFWSTDISGIWKSDGTEEGTTAFTSATGEIIPGTSILFSCNKSDGIINAHDPIAGGGVGVYTIETSINDREIVVLNDDIYLVDETDAEGREVVYVDITALGGGDFSATSTVLDTPIPGTVGSDPANLRTFNNKLYWVSLKTVATNPAGAGEKGLFEYDPVTDMTTEFYTFDPTSTGEMYNITTERLEIEVYAGLLYYQNMTGNPRVQNVLTSLFAYDGTNTFTILDEQTAGGGSIYGFNRIDFDDVVFGDLFLSIPGIGNRFLNGTTLSVAQVFIPNLFNYAELGTDLIFSKNEDASGNTQNNPVFKTDLSGNETKIADFDGSNALVDIRPTEFIEFGAEVFFTGYDISEGTQIWKTDGTTATRVTSSTFTSTKGSGVSEFFSYDGELYFYSFVDGIFNLYKTDGTEVGTSIALSDVNSAGSISQSAGVEFNGSYISAGTNFNQSMVKFDGAAFETLLDDTPDNLTTSGNNLFFTANTDTEGEELGVTDGTLGGTEVFDLFPGAGFSTFPEDLFDLNGLLYFRGVDPTNGTVSIWKSDGTEGGTEVIISDPAYDITDLAVFGQYLVYSRDDLFIGKELFTYNLTTQETTEIDLLEGDQDSSPRDLFVFNDAVYFVYFSNGVFASIGKLNFSDLSVTNLGQLDATEANGTFNSLVITENTASLAIRDSPRDYHQRVYITKDDQLVETDYSTYSNPVINGDVIYFTNGGLGRAEALKSNTGLASNSHYALFNDKLYFELTTDSVGAEVYSLTEDILADFTASSGMTIVQDSTSLDIAWTAGSGDSRILLAKRSSLPFRFPEDGTIYTANSELDASYLDDTNTSVLAVGDVNNAMATGFVPGVSYTFTLIEINNSDPENPIYDLINQYSFEFSLEKIDQVIIEDFPRTALATEVIDLDATTNAGFGLGYTVVDGPGNIINGNPQRLHFTGEGTVELLIDGGETANYNAPESVTVNIEVSKTLQEVNFVLDATTYEYEDESFSLSIESVDALTFTPTISGPGRYTFNAGTVASGVSGVIIESAGTIIVSAVNDGSNLYEPLNQSIEIIVEKTDQEVTINPIEDKSFNTTFLLRNGIDIVSSARSGSIQGEFNIEVLSGPAEVNEDNAQELTVTGTGTVTFEVINEGNENYNPAPIVQGSFEAIKASQNVTITNDLQEQYPFSTDATIDFSTLVTSSSGLPVSFVISEGPGFFSGENQDQYNVVSTGQVTLSAFATGNDNYETSTSIEVSFEVVKGSQSISWAGFEEISTELPGSIEYSPDGYTPLAEASSSLGIDYSIIQGDGSISEDGKFLITTSGVFTLRATQVGDDNWNEASEDYSFEVLRAAQVISFDQIDDKVRDEAGFTFSPTSSSGLEVTVQSSTGRTSYDGTQITYNNASSGLEELILTQQGNANYLPANQESVLFCIISPAPVLTIDNQSGGQIEIASDNTIDPHEFFLNGESLGSFSGGFFTFSEEGTYTARALSSDNCDPSEISNEIDFEPPLSVVSNNSIKVYPNPTVDVLQVETTKLLQVQLLSLDGRKIYAGTTENGLLDISTLSAGQYIIQLYEEGKLIKSEKIIKTN